MKTSVFSSIAIFGILILSMSGCIIDDDIFDCEKGRGDMTTEELYLSDFESIQLNIAADVYISQGPQLEVIVEGQRNIINLLETDVRNGEWEIEFDKCVKNYDKLDIFITMPEVKEITLAGSGDIFTESVILGDAIKLNISGSGTIFADVDAEDVEGRISGSGRINLGGVCDDLDFTISGSGELSAFDLLSEFGDITISGSGDAEVFIENTLKIRIPGSGNVFYKGNPDLDVIITGSGSVINAN